MNYVRLSTQRMLLLLTLVSVLMGSVQLAMSATVQSCDQYGITEINNKTYVVQNNAWNWDSTWKQCIDIDNVSGDFIVATSDAKRHTDGDPASYPSVYRGCTWGSNCTSSSSDMLPPVQVCNIVSAFTSWSTVQPNTGVYNAAYDIWFNKDLSIIPNQRPDGAELMIWLNYRGSIQPNGDKMPNALTIAGETWDVWIKNDSNCITYVKTTGTVSNLNLVSFFSDAESQGVVQMNWYLISVQAEFEIWQGGTGLKSRSFSVMVNAPLPAIKANGTAGSVSVLQSTPVSITVALDPVTHAGQNADWWIAAITPFGWYSYVYPSGWAQNVNLTAQAPLFTLSPAFELLNMNLPVGDYTFYFGVDMTPNRVLDSPLYFNAVQVHVAP